MLDIQNITKDYGPSRALHPVSVSVDKGEFITILGPSGCGKSTLLRILMGISRPSSGEIHLAGKRIDPLPPEARDIAMVFQSYALFPHMSVEKNLGFGLRMKRVDKAEQKRRIAHALEICNLTALSARMPRQLSGGQQQRVALARAIVMQPSLMLFDEPLSNLDAKLRDSLRAELVDLHRKVGATSLYVTHDQAEAMAMSDRILVMNGGRVVESGSPVDLYRRPKHAFTAGFLGLTNLVPVRAHGLQAALPWDGDPVLLTEERNGIARMALRPEAIRLEKAHHSPAEVTSTTFLGSNVLHLVKVAGMELKVTRSGTEPILEPGARVAIAIDGLQHLLVESDSVEAA
ncbi:ABC transporter permease [Xaviernesmea oryzae]|uniref:ABC transporter permease n=1 Tax=Xaviernesmea oryzae TaxID=464029 RepID=A0A1Q9ATW8_9HYPH|nr:ABC transporter ATP-binding protein [Xaviernesmea oryzae]OLP58875.1 ABC transporter permease [Xaviernesmea oryzae]SEM03185.1 carbohydrate ABC transporter ATP-binding protein, CUT1 family (TC 3.A.1.1.-) [Xaviernesmea oryzae]